MSRDNARRWVTVLIHDPREVVRTPHTRASETASRRAKTNSGGSGWNESDGGPKANQSRLFGDSSPEQIVSLDR